MTWVYDDQPQMVEAATQVRQPASYEDALVAAFATIDREALIEKAAREIVGAPTWNGLDEDGPMRKLRRREVEAVLVAAGIIPECER